MTAPSEPAVAATTEPTPGAIDALQQWLHSLRLVLKRVALVAVTEARLATVNLALILILAVASGLLLASAWIALFSAVVVWLHALGLDWPFALLLIAAVNLAVAFGGAYAIYRLSNNLLMKTLRTFMLATENPLDDDAVQSAARSAPPAP